MKQLKKLLGNNWTVTLVGIFIGGLLGVYLNSFFQTRTEKLEAAEAFERVLEELSDNNEELIYWDSLTKPHFRCVLDLVKYVEEGTNGIIVNENEKKKLLSKHSQVLELTDSIKISTDKTKYYWNMEFQLNLTKAMSLHNDIAWESMKSSHYLKHINFDCIAEIEYLNRTYEQAAKNKVKWFELYLKNTLKVNKGHEVFLYWKLERAFNKNSIELYPETIKQLKNCF